MKILRRINGALPDLVLGIIGYGLIVFGVGMIFVSAKTHFAIGLFTGIALAIFMAVNIAKVLNDAVYTGGNERLLQIKSVARYLVVTVVVFAVAYFKLGDIIAAFIGLMGLKASAYIQQYRYSKFPDADPEDNIEEKG